MHYKDMKLALYNDQHSKQNVSVLPYAERGGFRLRNSVFFRLVAGQDLPECNFRGIFVAC